jgi:hypothetical protein
MLQPVTSRRGILGSVTVGDTGSEGTVMPGNVVRGTVTGGNDTDGTLGPGRVVAGGFESPGTVMPGNVGVLGVDSPDPPCGGVVPDDRPGSAPEIVVADSPLGGTSPRSGATERGAPSSASAELVNRSTFRDPTRWRPARSAGTAAAGT